jgi:hypothetical protein
MRHGTRHARGPGRRAGHLWRAPDEKDYDINCKTRGRSVRPQRSRRWAGVPAAVAGIALLVAACGGGGSSTASGSTPYQKALAYSQCMRTHGDPGFPDPGSQGIYVESPANRDVFNGSLYLNADNSCHKLSPSGLTQAQLQQTTGRALKYSACMRTHGIANFPDPESKGAESAGGFNAGEIQSLGIDTNSPQFQSANQTCQKLTHVEGP